MPRVAAWTPRPEAESLGRGGATRNAPRGQRGTLQESYRVIRMNSKQRAGSSGCGTHAPARLAAQLTPSSSPQAGQAGQARSTLKHAQASGPSGGASASLGGAATGPSGAAGGGEVLGAAGELGAAGATAGGATTAAGAPGSASKATLAGWAAATSGSAAISAAISGSAVSCSRRAASAARRPRSS